jgi:4-amino-4-deoxy-L-arabinose transferase-like glycosyltransferase
MTSVDLGSRGPAAPAGPAVPPPGPAVPPPGPAAPPGPGVTPRTAPPATRWPGRPSPHGWATIAIGLLAAVLYTWGLARNGWANDYYAAAVRAGSLDWKAFFFGSIDPGNVITVDKPPAALWLMALSARLFGFNQWSVLLPQAACGVASVLIVHRLVRRWAGDMAAHLAALAFALTPVAAVMFRYNNPDALLTLLCVAAAWGLWSALESGRTRGLLVSAALIGLAFDTKMLQAFVVLPAFAGVYLWAGPPRLRRRLAQLTAALATVLVTAGWWIVVVALWPADSRPYIGSTDDNSILSLLFGYNGLSRIFGGEGAGPGGGAGGAGFGGGGPGGSGGFGGAVGWLRLFNPVNGGQISWLLPLALAGLAAGLWLTRHRPRTDLARAGWVLWGGWTLLCLVTFSRAQGIFHPYYSVQLAPAVGALAGAAGPALWRLGAGTPGGATSGTDRGRRWALRACLPVAVLVTAAWSVALLGRTPTYLPWLRTAVIAGAAAAVAGLWIGWTLRRRDVVVAAAAVAAVALLAGPAAYTVTTVQSPISGALAAAGPGAGAGGAVGNDGRGAGGFGGGFGGNQSADPGLLDYLRANRGGATYLVAAFGSQSSAPIIIATGEPVITIGGFGGGDPAPTLAQFRQLVAEGRVRFVLVGGGGPGRGGGQDISQWTVEHGTAVPASAYGSAAPASAAGEGGATSTLYDLAGVA